MCTVVKDQQRDIREFIDYHRWIGFEKFYVYDNNSTHPMRRVLSDYMQQGLVELVVTYGTKSNTGRFGGTPQHVAYSACIDNHRSKHQWLAFFDVDEFLLLRDQDTTRPPDVRAFLSDYSNYGGLAVSWVMFGSSGRLTPPINASTLTSYTKCAAAGSQHVKTIANTKYLLSTGPTPHTFKYRRGHPAVNEARRPVMSPKSNFTSARVVLLHYVLKSKADFAAKRARGGGARSKSKSRAFFAAVDRASNDTCLMAVERGRQFEACCFGGPRATQPLRPGAAAAAASAAGRKRAGRRRRRRRHRRIPS